MRFFISLFLVISFNLEAKDFNGHLVKVNDSENFYHFSSTTENFAYEQVSENIFLVHSSIKALRSQSFVELIEPNYLVSIQARDPLFEVSWGLQNLGHNEPRRGGGRFPVPGNVGADSNTMPAWEKTKGDKKVVIAVIDTGIDYQHPDLAENIWVNQLELNGGVGVDDDGNGYIDDIYGYNFSSNKPDPMDDNKHGTHVAGIIGARHNDKGIAGVMDEVQLMAVKFMDRKGRGDSAGAIKAINYATDMGAHVLNNSWGMLKESELVKEAFQRAADKNIISVVAAGNSYLNNDRYPRFPASFDLDGIITVAAYNAENRLTGFSCFGPQSVDIAAPGRNIISTVPGDKYEVLSGTSMAAPYVAGAIGLYLSRYPKAKIDEVKSRLIQTATKVPHLEGKILSEGRVDMGRFVQ